MRVNQMRIGEGGGGGEERFNLDVYIEPGRYPGVIVFDRNGVTAIKADRTGGYDKKSVIIGFAEFEGRPGIWYDAPFGGKAAWRGANLLEACGYKGDEDIDTSQIDLRGSHVVADVEDDERGAIDENKQPILDAENKPVMRVRSVIARLIVSRGGGAPTAEAAKADAETPTEGDLW